MANLPQIPGARKKGVVFLVSADGLDKLEEYHINDTVCIDGPSAVTLSLAQKISEKYKVGVKVVTTDEPLKDLPQDIEVVASPIQEIVGEGRAEAVKFKNGRVIGVCLVIFAEQSTVEALSPPPAQAGQADFFARLGLKGSQELLGLTRRSLEEAASREGKDANVGFTGTNYYLPLINALSGIEVKTIEDCFSAFVLAESLAGNETPPNGPFINAMGGLLNKGVSALICEEILAALAVSSHGHPSSGGGFIPDRTLRSLGLQLADGRISGIAVVIGPAKDEQAAAELIRDFQSKGIISFLAGSTDGLTFRQQLEKKGIAPALENYIVDLGSDYLSAVYAINFICRAPLLYGLIKPGQHAAVAEYIRNRLPAFLLLLGRVDEALAITGFGAMAFGMPVITDSDIPSLPKIETTLFEALVSEKDYRKIPAKCVLARGIKVKVAQVNLPVPYAAAYEGGHVRKEEMAAEFGGESGTAIEFLTMKDEPEVEDGKVELIGPDIDQLGPEAKAIPLAIAVDVFGRRMQKDFEPILQRQIHRFLNYAMGLTHMGQRDRLRIRISRDAFEKGFRLKHLGVILHAMLHQEYSAIVDKAQVRIYTGSDDVERLSSQARVVFNERDERLEAMTDENVDTFYSCLICQSFAPNHVCIITPERPGLCGAYSWLDAKASFEIVPTGPHQPVEKGRIMDERLGQWENVNQFVQQKSNKTIGKVSMYSLMDSPQSSCGCFECIAAIVPEANGVMIAHRDYPGITPSGMTFTGLAASVGGGVQTPGFLGVGKLYITSKKFISAEGGLKRVVWMSRELKDALADSLKKRAQEIGEPDLPDKIADETMAVSSEELLVFLRQAAHPALGMEPII